MRHRATTTTAGTPPAPPTGVHLYISIGGSLDFAQLETSGTDRRYNSAIGISYSCTILDKINA